MGSGVLDELLGLDIVHAVNTGNTVTVILVSPSASISICVLQSSVPDGEDTAGLSEAVLLLDATDPLLEDGGDLGGGGLRIGGVGSDLLRGVEDRRAGLVRRNRQYSVQVSAQWELLASRTATPIASSKLVASPMASIRASGSCGRWLRRWQAR